VDDVKREKEKEEIASRQGDPRTSSRRYNHAEEVLIAFVQLQTFSEDIFLERRNV
jgi:hypothetical protein